jgi:hypothetical protein
MPFVECDEGSEPDIHLPGPGIRQGAGNQVTGAAADEPTNIVTQQGWQAEEMPHVVGGGRQVGEAVDKGAVEVEDEEFFAHIAI